MSFLILPGSLPNRTGLPAVVLGLVAAALLPCPAFAAPNPIVVSGDPVHEALAQDGQGLCARSAVSMVPQIDFGLLTAPTFSAGINAFIDGMPLAAVHDETLGTIFDLSNNNATGLKLSYGDYLDSAPGNPACQTGGCPLYKNDTVTSFATRFRGYLNVTDAMVNQPLHFGFYADDAVSMQIFDNTPNSYTVVTRPPMLGAPTWRTTNQVTFRKPGLYPVEINYVEIVEHAALEMSILVGRFDDFELPANQMGSTSLRQSGFSLMLPKSFFQTENGLTSFPDPAACKQCGRQFAGSGGNSGCDSGYYCNKAALCAPCNSTTYCGPSCSPCGGSTPHCTNVNGTFTCVPCLTDNDCPNGRHCDLGTHQCQDCNKDDDCERGKVCNPSHACVPCSTSDSCAGVSCNCCPAGARTCAVLPGDQRPTCVECTADADCKGRRCDIQNGRCVDSVLQCNTADHCGRQCSRCPADRPYCVLAIPDVGSADAACAECRNDNDCNAGKYCLGGECTTCASDRHCGSRCTACQGDTPFCYLPAPMEGLGGEPLCVRCLTDADCHGGHCDPRKHSCDNTCPMSCAAGTVCDGSRCVSCYNDSQCCGGSCNIESGTCEQSCKETTDCLGTEHCAGNECKPGRQNPNEAPPPCNYGICSTAPIGGGRDASGGASGALAAGIALVLSGLRARRRRRE